MLSEVTACTAYNYETLAIVSRRIDYYLNEANYTLRGLELCLCLHR